jgi:hypothetical protein
VDFAILPEDNNQMISAMGKEIQVPPPNQNEIPQAQPGILNLNGNPSSL